MLFAQTGDESREREADLPNNDLRKLLERERCKKKDLPFNEYLHWVARPPEEVSKTAQHADGVN